MKKIFCVAALAMGCNLFAQSPGVFVVVDPVEAIKKGALRYGDRVMELNMPVVDLEGTTIRHGSVSVASNRAAGGAVWSWKYNKYEFVNRHDYGRLFQGALFSQSGERTPMLTPVYSAYIPGLPIQYNPTEAGSGMRVKGTEPMYGSPCIHLFAKDDYTDTVSVPLEFFPADFNGRPDLLYHPDTKPVIYPEVRIGKTIRLFAMDVSDVVNPYLPPVSEYVTKYYSPVNLDLRDPALERDYNTPSRTTSFYLNGKMKNSYIQYFPNNVGDSIPDEKSVGSEHSGAGSGDYSYYVMREDPVNGMAFGIYIKKGYSNVTQVQTPSPHVGEDDGHPDANSTGILQVYNTGAVPMGWSEMRIFVVCGPTDMVRTALRNIWFQTEMNRPKTESNPWSTRTTNPEKSRRRGVGKPSNN